jgi:hypothetical protein
MVISSRVFNRIDERRRTKLGKTSCLMGAGGALIREVGKAEFTIKLGPLEVIIEAIVADIEDDVLLGYEGS